MMEDKVKEVKYEFEKLASTIAMSDCFWEDAEIPALAIAKLAHEQFVRAMITWYVARRRLADYQWCATWRDAFKERWFPAWAKRRWPVRYKRVAVDELAAIRREDDEKTRYLIS